MGMLINQSYKPQNLTSGDKKKLYHHNKIFWQKIENMFKHADQFYHDYLLEHENIIFIMPEKTYKIRQRKNLLLEHWNIEYQSNIDKGRCITR